MQSLILHLFEWLVVKFNFYCFICNLNDFNVDIFLIKIASLSIFSPSLFFRWFIKSYKLFNEAECSEKHKQEKYLVIFVISDRHIHRWKRRMIIKIRRRRRKICIRSQLSGEEKKKLEIYIFSIKRASSIDVKIFIH